MKNIYIILTIGLLFISVFIGLFLTSKRMDVLQKRQDEIQEMIDLSQTIDKETISTLISTIEVHDENVDILKEKFAYQEEINDQLIEKINAIVNYLTQ